MATSYWEQLERLVLVAGHAVYVGQDFLRPEDDRNWFLQPFQRGEPPYYIEHIRAGIDLTARDSLSLLIFSGGQTRLEAGPRSKAQSYWNLADHYRWWSLPGVSKRATTEEFARDSFENLLFGICRFRECTGRYPERVTVVSWTFKEERFSLHREALRFPESRFTFHGANQPADLPAGAEGRSQGDRGLHVRSIRHGKQFGPEASRPKSLWAMASLCSELSRPRRPAPVPRPQPIRGVYSMVAPKGKRRPNLALQRTRPAAAVLASIQTQTKDTNKGGHKQRGRS